MSSKDKCAIDFPTLPSDLVASLACSARAIVISLLGSFFSFSISPFYESYYGATVGIQFNLQLSSFQH